MGLEILEIIEILEIFEILAKGSALPASIRLDLASLTLARLRRTWNIG